MKAMHYHCLQGDTFGVICAFFHTGGMTSDLRHVVQKLLNAPFIMFLFCKYIWNWLTGLAASTEADWQPQLSRLISRKLTLKRYRKIPYQNFVLLSATDMPLGDNSKALYTGHAKRSSHVKNFSDFLNNCTELLHKINLKRRWVINKRL